MRDIDFNAYRAFKIIGEENKTKRNAYELLNGNYNIMKFPFGLKEKRFRWLRSTNVGENKELTGNLVRRSSAIHWNEEANKKEQGQGRKGITNKAAAYKYELEKNSKRTINPENETSIPHYRKTESSKIGSIENLIRKTPLLERKHKNFIAPGSEIFTASEPFNHRCRMAVNIQYYIDSKEYAGKVTTIREITNTRYEDILILVYVKK